MTIRLSWRQYFSEIVKATMKHPSRERLQVDPLLVRDNRIISQGYNGFLPGYPHKSIIRDNHEQSTVHAEQNAVADCAKRGVSCINCTAYITHYPCINCCKILLASGINEIVYLKDYKNDPIVAELCSQLNFNIKKIN